jgi:hypothetical protein
MGRVSSRRAVTLQALNLCLGVTEEEVDEALRELEVDFMAADRGIQLCRQPYGIRIETSLSTLS